MSYRTVFLLAALPLVSACASSGGSQTGQAGPRHDPYVITAAELATANASNLFDAIRQLRPRWLERLGPTTFGGAEYRIMVYTDRIQFGSVDMLRQVPVSLPLSVRYYSASEAQGEFGVGNLQGAIQIVTRRQR